jgi:hypothetical protein
MLLSRWKLMAGILGVSIGGLAAAASQCPKFDKTKGRQPEATAKADAKVPPAGAPTAPAPALELPTVPQLAPAGSTAPAPTIPPAPTPPAPSVELPKPADVTPPAPSLPPIPAKPADPKPPEVTKPTTPSAPTTPLIDLIPPAPTKPPEAKPTTPPAPPTLDPFVVTPKTIPSVPPTTAGATQPSNPGAPVASPPNTTPAVPPVGAPDFPTLPPRAEVPPPPPLTPQPSPPAPVAETKFRILLRVGDGEPMFEVKNGDNLVLKVACEKVDIKSPEKGGGMSEVIARGKVRFAGFGAEGTCDELKFMAGTGEVQMTGDVKVQVKDKLGRVESELSTATMKYKIDASSVGGAIKP